MKSFNRFREGEIDEDSGDYEEYCGDCAFIKDLEDGTIVL